MRLLSLLSAGVSLLGASLPAQTPPAVEVPPGLHLEDLPPEVQAQLAGQGGAPAQGAEPGAQDAAKQAAEQKAQRRLQAFKKVVFDRRPSSILKAWAQPELKPYDPSEEAQQPSGAGDAPRAPAPDAGGEMRILPVQRSAATTTARGAAAGTTTTAP
ncbi:MAG: hypothetical protein ACON4Z_16675, partial [Planctomycetota bacterium]